MSASTELGPIELSSPGCEPNCMQGVRFEADDADTIDATSILVACDNGGLVPSNYQRVNAETVTIAGEEFTAGRVIYYQLQATAVEAGDYKALITFTTLGGRTITAEKAITVGNLRSR